LLALLILKIFSLSSYISFINGQVNNHAFANGDTARNFQELGTFYTGSGLDLIDLTQTNDSYDNQIQTNAGNDTVRGGSGGDTIDLGSGDDIGYGNSVNDRITGGEGNDLINGGENADTLDGGAGIDTVDYSTSPAEVIINLQTGQVDGGYKVVQISTNPVRWRLAIVSDAQSIQINESSGFTTAEFSDTLTGFENIIGTNFRDSLTGNSADNIISPGLSNANIQFGFLTDAVDGGAGKDLLVVDYSSVVGPVGLGVGGLGDSSGNYAFAGVSGGGIRSTNMEYVQITGTEKNDTIYGFDGGDDTINGAGGDDFLVGGYGFSNSFNIMGNDIINGGEGNDAIFNRNLYGGNLNDLNLFDRLDGGVGNDTLSAEFSNQTANITFISGQSNDIVFADGAYAKSFEHLRYFTAGSGNDLIVQTHALPPIVFGTTSDTYENRFFAGAGNDTINGGLGIDFIDGGTGDDLLIIDYSVGDNPGLSGLSSSVRTTGSLTSIFTFERRNATTPQDQVSGTDFERFQITGTSKADNIVAWIGNDTLSGGAGNDTIGGGGGNDYLTGGEGADSLDGGSDSDILIGSNGDFDTLVGGAGNDVYEVYTGNIITEAAGGGIDWVYAVADYTLGANQENLILWETGNVNGTGNAENNALYGNIGNNQLNGGAGIDYLLGGGGNDTLSAGTGNDYLNGGVGSDSLDGGNDSDILIGSNGDLDTLAGGAGDDVYEVYTGNVITEAAGEGRDWIYANSDYTLGANQENLILWETGNVNGTGNAENNALYGNIGNNQLNGGAGIDYLLGGGGNDTLNAGDGNDYLNGGVGNDSLDGGEGSDILIGSNGDLDTLVGGAGDDVFEVYTGNTVTEAAGGGIDWVYAVVDYTLGANLEKLVLWEAANINGTGNSEDNYLYGNVGNNQLAGGTGNDSLFGGAGNDSLTGGLGNDEFIFRGVFGTLGVDTITDFTLSADKIALSKTTFNLASAVTTGVNFGFSIAGEFASVSGSEDTSNALIVYNSSTGGLFYNQNGSNAGFGTGGQFAALTGNPTLIATDFRII
jgi:Ca2+-binding RTX toxin-like protein